MLGTLSRGSVSLVGWAGLSFLTGVLTPPALGKRAGRRWKSESSPSSFLPEGVGRKIQIQRSGHLNLYLLLDASQSVAEEDFRIFRKSATIMVDRVRKWEPVWCGGRGLPAPAASVCFPPSEPHSQPTSFNKSSQITCMS